MPRTREELVDATAYLAPYRQLHVRRPVRLRITQDTYPLEESPEHSWLPIAFRAFARLARRLPVRDVLMLGSGNGLDALGAIEIFDLASLAATDLRPESVAVIRDNVVAHLEGRTGITLGFYAGDLLAGIPTNAQFDLVYENLPNLPATPNLALELGTHSGRFHDATDRGAPGPFDAYLLALHERCLGQAHGQVRPGGGVLTAIGGRMPHAVAFELHRACGYAPELIAFDVKLQAEPALVIPAYRRIEQERGVEFTFYAGEAVTLVAAARRSGLEGQALADAVAGELAGLAISAREADERWRRGEPVAHSVLMLFGQRRPC